MPQDTSRQTMVTWQGRKSCVEQEGSWATRVDTSLTHSSVCAFRRLGGSQEGSVTEPPPTPQSPGLSILEGGYRKKTNSSCPQEHRGPCMPLPILQAEFCGPRSRLYATGSSKSPAERGQLGEWAGPETQALSSDLTFKVLQPAAGLSRL